MKKTQSINEDVEHKALHDEYLKAFDRTGKNREDFGVWLLNFAQTDIAKLSAGDGLNLAYEILVFAHQGMQGFPSKPRFFLDDKLGIDNFLSREMIPSIEQIVELQSWFSGLIKNVIKREIIQFEYPQKSILIPPEKEGEIWTEVITTDDIGIAFSFVCIELIKGIAHRFKQCRGCKTIFFMSRTDQDYCSTNCQARTYMRVKRSKEERGRDHGKKRK